MNTNPGRATSGVILMRFTNCAMHHHLYYSHRLEFDLVVNNIGAILHNKAGP